MFKSKVLKLGLLVLLVAAMCVPAISAERSGRRRGGPLQLLPADTLFCVRLNNMNQTGDALQAFLNGVIDEDDNVKEGMVEMLTKALGQDEVSGIRLGGNFALFGLVLPVEGQNMNPFAGLFVGALLPVGNFDEFVSGNPNVGEAGSDGICEIKVDGGVRGLATSVRRFALVTEGANHANLLKAKEILMSRDNRLAGALDQQERVLSNQPIWAYGNVKQASRIIGPFVYMGLEGMKMQLKQMQEKGEGPMVGNVEGIIDFYSAIINFILEGTDHVSLAADPSADACRFTFAFKAVDGTLMDELVVSAPDAEIGSLAGYLEDGAIFNLITKINKGPMRTAYVELIDLMIKIAGDKMDAAEAEKLRALTIKGINSLGDGAAITFNAGTSDGDLFGMKSVMRISDEEAYGSVIAESMKMMADGAFDKLYASFGMKLNLSAKTETAEYKGVKVNKARIKFSMGEGDSKENEAMKKIFGEGLDYSWAVVDGHAVESLGSDCESAVRKLIDQVRAGGPGEPSSELLRAHDIFMGDREEEPLYDFGGTVNIVRFMNMISSVMSSASEGQIKPVNLQSSNNVVFAGRCNDGLVTVDVVLPKDHLLEIKAGGEQFGETIKAAEGR